MSWTGLEPYLLLVVFGFLPSEVWRLLAVALSRGLDEEAEALVWVRHVATALLAGVVAKLLLAPGGALAAVALPWRLGALAAGLLSFLALRRSVLAGVLVGEAVLIGAAAWA